MNERDYTLNGAERRAMSAGEAYLATRYPESFRNGSMQMVIKSVGATWEVSYKFDGMIGGRRWVVVDMLTGEVKGSYVDGQ